MHPSKLTKQPNVDRPAETATESHPPQRIAKPRLGGSRQAGLIRLNYGSVKPRGSARRDSRKDESDKVDRRDGDCGSESASVLLINPDMNVLPVVKTEQAKGAFDFYVRSYVTSIIEVSPDNVDSYSNVVQQILHDELLFTAFTTCSEAARWRTKSLYEDAPLGVVRGYGKTVALLSERLRSPGSMATPTVLLTMGQLVAIETMIKNVSATARHLAGMQGALKPSSNTSRQKGSAPVQTATDIWTQYFMQRAMIKSTIPRTEPLTYPKHPFSPKINTQIAGVPAGFSDVAISGRLSIQMLDLLERFDGYFTRVLHFREEGIVDSPERTQVVLGQVAYCIEYHQMQLLSTIERLVLAALTAYVVRRDRVHPALINIRNYFQIACAYQVNLLSSAPTIIHHQDQGSDLLVWIGLTLLLTSSPEAHARKLALKLLPKKPEPLKMLKKCQRFFWDDDLTNALLSGEVLVTKASNDIIGDNIKLASLEAEN